MSEVQNIKVAVRCRPQNKREKDRGEENIFSIKSGNVSLRHPETNKETKFNFDRIFLEDSEQIQVW